MSDHRLTSLSVVIPAWNEEKYMRPGIAAMRAEIAHATARRPDLNVEVILVDNDSSDRTAGIACGAGYRVVREAEHKISRVRNTGAQAATGQALLTIDADSRIGEGTLTEALSRLEAGAVGGGCRRIRMDCGSAMRNFEAGLVMFVINRLMGLGGGVYYCRKSDFDAIRGFNEELYAAEDVEFAARLKAHGGKTGRPFVNLREAALTTSSRKFDLVGRRRLFGLLFRTCWRVNSAVRRKELWDMLFYDIDRLR